MSVIRWYVQAAVAIVLQQAGLLGLLLEGKKELGGVACLNSSKGFT